MRGVSELNFFCKTGKVISDYYSQDTAHAHIEEIGHDSTLRIRTSVRLLEILRQESRLKVRMDLTS